MTETKACSVCNVPKPLANFRRRWTRVEGRQAFHSRCFACEGRGQSGDFACDLPDCDYRGETKRARSLHRSIKHGLRSAATSRARLNAKQQSRVEYLRSLIAKGDRIDSAGALALLFGRVGGKTGGPMRPRGVA